ncbi:hypothetical protein Anas_07550 [Armadillidium nasatum]|uniref:Uncharacterized protein n=1 Tax=Armadillidium nasatum TaxID=96803 RepID=A0A5N5SQD4_9CRUS|nr:hypothetical protein Anas_07550 [Armadillidium nasatum]
MLLLSGSGMKHIMQHH